LTEVIEGKNSIPAERPLARRDRVEKKKIEIALADR